jgi:DHA2 family multidrug resistance protein
MIVVFRLLQGLAGGGLQPIQMSIVMDAFPPEKRGTAFGITGMTMIVAPILGPTLGGYITDSFNWRWIFFMNVPVGILAFLLVKRLVTDPEHAKGTGLVSLDYIGLSLVVLGLGALQVVLDKGQEEDWFASHFIQAFSVLSVVALAAALVWLSRQKDPIIDIRLLSTRSFGMACLMIFFVGFALYGSSALLPLMLQSQFGYDATLAGLVLSPGGLVLVFLMPFVGKMVNKFQARTLIGFGMLALSCGMYYTSFISPQDDYDHFVMMRLAQVIGLPFMFIPSSTLAFSDIPPEKGSKASALYALLRNLGGSVGISILSSYVVRHQQIHQAVLVEHLAPTQPAYRFLLNQYTQAIIASGSNAATAALSASSKLYQELLAQASLLAYSDAFRFLSAITLLLAVCSLLMPRTRKHAAPVELAAH